MDSDDITSINRILDNRVTNLIIVGSITAALAIIFLIIAGVTMIDYTINQTKSGDVPARCAK